MVRAQQRSSRRPPTTMPRERADHDAELIDDMGDFLDEVDALLEDQEWMTRYRARGGQ